MITSSPFSQFPLPPSISTALEGAIKMQKLGFKVFPVWGVVRGICQCRRGSNCPSAGKHPVEEGWQTSTTMNDEVAIRQYWLLHPNTNFGVNTHGHVVLDIDERSDGYENYKMHFKKIVEANPTLIIQTGSGSDSLHIIYRSDKNFRNVTKLFKGIDVRSSGAFIVGLGSNHKTGGTYKMYYSGTDETDVINIADLPLEIESLLSKKWDFRAENILRGNADEKAMLAFGVKIPDGQRNKTLFIKACQLRQKGLSAQDIRPIIQWINTYQCSPPLNEAELETTILKSVANYPAGGVSDWKEPILDYNLKDPVCQDIEENQLPEIFRKYVIVKSISLGIPKSAVLVSTMTHFSALLGTVFKVRPKFGNNYAVSLNLWGLIIAMPSSRKTAALEVLLKSLEQVQEFFLRRRDIFISERRENISKLNLERKNLNEFVKKSKSENELSLHNKKINEIEIELAKLKDTPIPYWIFKTSDSTPEALALIFRDNARGILFFRDEMQGLFSILAKQGYENLRSLLTEAWNGNKSYTVNRIERGLIAIPSMTLSVLGSVQPDVLYSSFSDELQKGMGGDGFIQRFQLISQYSLSQVSEPNDAMSTETEQQSMDFLVGAVHALTKDKNLEPVMQPSYLILSAEAHAMYKEYREHLYNIIRSDDITNSAYQAHLGKLDRLVLSLAGQLHILRHASKMEPIQNEIEIRNVIEAIQVAKYMESQIFHLYFKVGRNLHAKALIAKIKSQEIKDGVSVRSIYKHGWSYLKNSDDMLAAVEEISDSNWVRIVKEIPSGGGAPTNILRINPKLIEVLNSKADKNYE